jgi:hypothetical protein
MQVWIRGRAKVKNIVMRCLVDFFDKWGSPIGCNLSGDRQRLECNKYEKSLPGV